MNKKFILPIVLLLFLMSVVLVSAISYNSFTWINGNENSESADLRYDVYLTQGWNLVPAFYKLNRIADSSEIKSSDIKVVYFYLPDKSKYAQVYPEDTSSNQDFLDSYYQTKTVIPYSSWIYSEKSGVLEFNVYGQNKNVFDSIPLKSGWNFLGVNKNLANKKLRDIIGNCDISKAYLWNNYEHIAQQDGSVLVRDIDPKWEQINIDTTFAKAGWMRGIIVKVNQDCNLAISNGGQNQLPPLPN